MITGLNLYLLLKLDGIHNILIIGVVLSILSIVFILFGLLFMCLDDYQDVDDIKMKLLTPSKIAITVLLSCGILSAIVPTTKEAAIIMAVPSIVNNVEVNNEVKDVYNLAKEFLIEKAK